MDARQQFADSIELSSSEDEEIQDCDCYDNSDSEGNESIDDDLQEGMEIGDDHQEAMMDFSVPPLLSPIPPFVSIPIDGVLLISRNYSSVSLSVMGSFAVPPGMELSVVLRTINVENEE